MSKVFTVPARFIRAAAACQAKNDVRYYLQGVFCGANGDIVGTNGHILFIARDAIPEDQRPLEDVIIAIDGKIPVTADSVTIHLETLTARTNKGKVFGVSVVDGKYPDYARVMRDQTTAQPDCDYADGTGVNPEYLTRISEVFKGCDMVDMVQHGKDSALVLTTHCAGFENALMLVMPCRSATSFTPLRLA